MMLKGIKSLFVEHEEGLTSTLLSIILGSQISSELQKGLLKATSRMKEHPELLHSYNLMLEKIKEPASHLRRTIVKYCMNYLGNKKDGLFKDTELGDFKYLVWKWDIISQHRKYIDEATDCSVLYWTKDLIPLFYAEIYRNPNELKRIKFLNMAIADAVPLLKSAVHLENKDELYQDFKKEVIVYFNQVKFSL